MTDAVEADAWAYLEKIDGMGGAVAAIEAGYMQEEIEQAAYAYTKAVDSGTKVIVGVNRYVDDQPEPAEVFPIDPALQAPPDRAGAPDPGRAGSGRGRRRPGRRRPRPPGAAPTCCRRCGKPSACGPPSARSATSCGPSSASTSRAARTSRAGPHGHHRRGPGGNTAATYAARLGAEVTLIERDIVGGAAHLWDCIPSKTMIATGGAMSFTRRIEGMGLAHQDASLDLDAQRRRVQEIEAHLNGR